LILQALVKYYNILSKDSEIDIPLFGYNKVNVSYAVYLSIDGTIQNIIPLKILDSKGKKYIPVSMVVPEQEKRTSGIKSNFLCDNSSYVFGIDNKDNPERAKKCFEAFKELHLKVLDNVTCDEAVAIKNYVLKWDVEKAKDCTPLKDYLDEILEGANIVFQYEGNPNGYIHENLLIKAVWEKYKNKSGDADQKECLVTGEKGVIARPHPSVKGIMGGLSVGNSLVSFNAQAYESYGNDKSQGLNAPVSEYATFAYTTALNYLLKDKAHILTIGDTTVVFWAESPRKLFTDCISLFLAPDELRKAEDNKEEYVTDEDAVREIKSIFEKIASGKKIMLSDDTIDKSTRMYVLGLSPNAARISIRFFLQDSFGGFIEKIGKHYQDLSVERQFKDEPNSFSVWRLLYETVPPESKEKSASPLLAGTTMRSILQGLPYPISLYNAIMLRIRAEKRVNYFKAAIIKGYLIRNEDTKNKYKEVLTMSLNTKSSNKAYVLGRLFAVLEKAQLDANPDIKSTIKDRYFTSACATPASVFPILLRLSNHHITKAEYGYVSENRIKELMDILDIENNPFPRHLSLDEQGIFILGYYHQKNALYKLVGKENKNE